MRKFIVLAATITLLASCTQAQIDRANVYQQQIASACAVAMSPPVLAISGPIAPYIIAGCGTEAMIAALALDPTSLAWINELIAKVRTPRPRG